MFVMRFYNPYESSILFKLAINPEFVILSFSFMVLRRYVFSSKKWRRCKYILNGSLPSSAKICILLNLWISNHAFDTFFKRFSISLCFNLKEWMLILNMCTVLLFLSLFLKNKTYTLLRYTLVYRYNYLSLI